MGIERALSYLNSLSEITWWLALEAIVKAAEEFNLPALQGNASGFDAIS